MGLLLGFNLESRAGRDLQAYCGKHGHIYKNVPADQQWKKLSVLAGLEPETERHGFTAAFSGPMLVICLFSEKQMDDLLKTMRQTGADIPLKAVLTPSNARWTAAVLQKELEKEREAFFTGKEKKR